MRLSALIVMLVPGLLLAAASQKSSRSAALHRFFEEEWEWEMREFPERATSLGDFRYNDRLADRSLEAIEGRKRHTKEALGRLTRIDRERLSDGDRLSYDLFRRRLEVSIAGDRFPDEWMPLSQQNGIHKSFPNLVTATAFRHAKDYRDYLARLSAFPRAIDQTIALMEKGRENGWVQPRVPLRGVPDALRGLAAGDSEKSVHFRPFEKFPDSLPAGEREELKSLARSRIAEQVVPAYRKLLDYLTGVYLPAAATDVGAWTLPNGEAYYAHRIREETTTEKTAKEIHEIGVAEVARIRALMEEVVRKSGFAGGFDGYVAFLRSDTRFYYSDAGELLRGYRDICKRIDGELPKLFGTLPRLTYGVAPTPEFEAPISTTAYYRPGSPEAGRAGTFVANTYRLETRPKYEMEALTIHEAVPGHHLQIALAQELTGLPRFRRHGGLTAFVEGWALYAESLGEEMGFYTEPASKFGQLTYEMWRAVRLVVDTGIHAMKWDRQRAIDFFKANTAKTEHDIAIEIDRYIVWPGQALAYKLGELKIKELRARAQKELGEKFDLRKFHDAVLLSGPLPLDVLEERLARWIEGEKRK